MVAQRDQIPVANAFDPRPPLRGRQVAKAARLVGTKTAPTNPAVTEPARNRIQGPFALPASRSAAVLAVSEGQPFPAHNTLTSVRPAERLERNPRAATGTAANSRGWAGSCMTNDLSQLDRQLADLMSAAQGGEQIAYAQLLNALAPLLRRSIKRWRPFLKPEDVEDLVQDTLLSLHEARATYDPARPLLPWVMAIARNRMIDGARRFISRTAREVAVDKLPETFSDDEANVIEGGYGDPEALQLAISSLPHGQRQAIEMMKLREMSLKEASAHSGASVAALKVAVHRGMAALRKAMGSRP